MAPPNRKDLVEGDALDDAAAALPDWDVAPDKLSRRFVFENFSEAFAFMTRVALLAEKLDHHPNWSNVWNRVDMDVTNHEAGGVTELDVEFCRRVDALVGS